MFKCYQYGKTGLFISDCENITKGTFGLMFRLSEPKIYFFSVKYGFNDKMLKEVLENIEGISENDRKIILETPDKKRKRGTVWIYAFWLYSSSRRQAVNRR